jgi:cell division protease FtsH
MHGVSTCALLERRLNNQWFSKSCSLVGDRAWSYLPCSSNLIRGAAAGANMLGYSDFLEEVRNKHIKSAVIQEGQGGTEILADHDR